MGTGTTTIFDPAGKGRAEGFDFRSTLLIGALLTAATVVRSPIIAAFETYDHPLNQIAFRLMMRLPDLPKLATHDLVMGLGFALPAFAVAIPFCAFLGKRSWWIIGLLFLWLNVLWAIEVELEVADSLSRELRESWRLSVLSTYLADSIGAFIGAWSGAAAFERVRRAFSSRVSLHEGQA